MTAEEEVCAMAMQFYDGIDDMASGRGIDKIQQAWEHGDQVTAGHPSGEWSQGWAEIVVGFELFAALGLHRLSAVTSQGRGTSIGTGWASICTDCSSRTLEARARCTCCMRGSSDRS